MINHVRLQFRNDIRWNKLHSYRGGVIVCRTYRNQWFHLYTRYVADK